MTVWYWYVRKLTSLWPSISIGGETLAVFPGVYKPLENEHWAARHCRPRDRVLDLGCGCGVLAVFAASVAREVVAVDISEVAVRNTRENCVRLRRTNVRVERSDMFTNVNGTFDVILANPPYVPIDVGQRVEQFATSSRYLPTLFREAPGYLSSNGRLVVQYPLGEAKVLEALAEENGLTLTRVEPLPPRDLALSLLSVLYLQAGLRSTLFVFEVTQGAKA